MMVKRSLGQPPTSDKPSVKRVKPYKAPSRTRADANTSVDFVVVYPAMNSMEKQSKKELELVQAAEYQVSPFVGKGGTQGQMDLHYTVTPQNKWKPMKEWANCVLKQDPYKINQIVYVKCDHKFGKDFFVARILQIKGRPEEPKHVYALVVWLYWPEELPPPACKPTDLVDKSGRREYHGSNELVASNHLEVVDVCSFAGQAEVSHWGEEDDNVPTKLYWRQTYCLQKKELSSIREHCICSGHFNPSGEPMYICDNPSCKVWLHKACLIGSALTKAHQELTAENLEENGTAKKDRARKVYQGKFKGEIIDEDTSAPKIKITSLRADANGKSWLENLKCLKCGTALE